MMEYAPLWKRVVREGMLGWDGDKKDRLVPEITRAPIIIDGRPGDPYRIIEQGSAKGLAFPFPTFWLEGVIADGVPWGSFVQVTERDNGWQVGIAGVSAIQSGVVACIGFYMFDVDSSGNMIEDSRQYASPRELLSKMGRSACKDICRSIQGLTCDTLQLLGCKNVGLSPRRQPDAAIVREATSRNGGHATGYRYHVLVVRPPGARSDAPAQEIGSMPRHVCRGHFSEYGPEYGKGLLFGKYAGRFYVPPHLKGKVENGVVDKDYCIKPNPRPLRPERSRTPALG